MGRSLLVVAALTLGTGCQFMGGGSSGPAGGPAGRSTAPAKPVPPEQLQAWLPATLGGHERRLGTPGPQVMEQGGMTATVVTGVYGPPDRTLTVTVMDMPGMAAAMGTAGQTNATYGDQEFRTVEIAGYPGTLHYVRSRRTGNAMVTVGDRFRVTAGGAGLTQDEVIAAARELPLRELDALDE